MNGLSQIGLQVTGGFLAGVCVVLWDERKRRIRREKELKELFMNTLKQANADIVKAQANAVRHAGAETYDLTTEVGKRACLARLESEAGK